MDIKAENDKKKEYLWGYQRAKRQMERLEEELAELRLDKMCPSVIQDGMPHASGGGDLSGYAARVDTLERKILKARYKKIQRFKEIRDRIEGLEDENEKDVLVYRNGYHFTEIDSMFEAILSKTVSEVSRDVEGCIQFNL